MRLWIAVFLRCLPLDALRPHWPLEEQAFAVLDQERVAALTPAARQAGVKPGMRRAGAAHARLDAGLAGGGGEGGDAFLIQDGERLLLKRPVRA